MPKPFKPHIRFIDGRYRVMNAPALSMITGPHDMELTLAAVRYVRNMTARRKYQAALLADPSLPRGEPGYCVYWEGEQVYP